MRITKGNILYHNVEYIEETPLGNRLYRYPLEVIQHLNPRARMKSQYACGCELRFVTESNRIHVDFIVTGGEGVIMATVLKGDYVHDVVPVTPGRITTLEIVEREWPAAQQKVFCAGNDFSPNVWRVHFQRCFCTVCSVDAMGHAIRPPYDSEMPRKKLLAYGSSITHGARSITHTNSFVNEAGRILGVDVFNKGVGGSCFYEPEIADFFAKDTDWDYAWIEGAINATLLPEEVFEERFPYFVDTLYKTGKPLFIPTILPNAGLYDENSLHYKKMQHYNEIIRAQKDKAVIIEGEDIITDLRFLTTDGVHPSNEGHTRMGINLANILKNYL